MNEPCPIPSLPESRGRIFAREQKESSLAPNIALYGISFAPASVLLRGFASNPIEIGENTAGHLAAAKCWPQDGFSPRL